MNPSPEPVIQSVAMVAFMQANPHSRLGATGSACLIDGGWVELPASYVLQALRGKHTDDVDATAYRLTIDVDLRRGGLYQGRRDMQNLRDAIGGTLEAHGVDSDPDLVEAVLSSLAESVVINPARPLKKPQPSVQDAEPAYGTHVQMVDISDLVVGDTVLYNDDQYTVGKIKRKKKHEAVVKLYRNTDTDDEQSTPLRVAREKLVSAGATAWRQNA